MTGEHRKPGADGSALDALTAPLPVLLGCGVIGLLVAVEAAVGVAIVLGLLTWAVASMRGVRRSSAARREKRTAELRQQARRAQLTSKRADHWQRMRHSADDSVDRFDRAVQRCRQGPLHDRLAGIEADVRHAQREVHTLCDIGMDLEVELARARARDRTAMRDRRDAVEERVQAIDASLASAVGVALELALESLGTPAGETVDRLVDELTLLRESLNEVQALEG